MEAEFKALEEKIVQLVEVCRVLRSDCSQLRQQLATSVAENKRLGEKIDAAKNNLENLLAKIPESEL